MKATDPVALFDDEGVPTAENTIVLPKSAVLPTLSKSAFLDNSRTESEVLSNVATSGYN